MIRLPPDETRIIESVIGRALDYGLSVRVSDEVECVLERTTNIAAIRRVTGHSSETVMGFYDGPRRVGWVKFIHGRGADVISVYTENATMDRICAQ